MFPNENEEHLLKAALLSGDEGLASYNKWKSAVDINDVEPAVAKLFPLLAHHQDEQTAKFNGSLKRTWLANQRLFHQLQPLFKRLNAADIPIIALKGFAVNVAIHKSFKLRPMNDIDVLIPKRALDETLKILDEAKYLLHDQCSDRRGHFNYRHSLAFKSPGGAIVDLHCYILEECCVDNDDHPFIDYSYPVEMKGVSLRIPELTELLFHTITHGMRWNPNSSIRWITDSHAILMKGSTDWERFFAYARRYELVSPIQEALIFLDKTFSDLIPKEVVGLVRELRPTKNDRREFSFHASSYKSFFKVVRHNLYHYRNFSRKREGVSFFCFCRDYWKLPSRSLVPLEMVKKTFKKIKMRKSGIVSTIWNG